MTVSPGHSIMSSREKIRTVITNAPGNGAPIGGIKVITENGWFAARPSGTEDIYKIYAESFLGADHLNRIVGSPSNSQRGTRPGDQSSVALRSAD